MARGASIRSLAATREGALRSALSRWLVIILIAMTMGVLDGHHRNHPDFPPGPAPIASVDAASQDAAQDGTPMKSLFGFNYAAHSAAHGSALPVSLDVSFLREVSNHRWPLIEDQFRASQGGATLLRPPRA